LLSLQNGCCKLLVLQSSCCKLLPQIVDASCYRKLLSQIVTARCDCNKIVATGYYCKLFLQDCQLPFPNCCWTVVRDCCFKLVLYVC
jgi:hypothetical protein